MNKPVRTALFGAGVIGALVAGGATASFAQSTTTSGSDSSTTQATTPAAPSSGQPNSSGTQTQKPQFDPSKGGHTANGITETLLTGDTATKVTDAAKAAVPGATIERVETDAEGAAYEAHVVLADGTHKTVTFNADYSVVAIQADQGPGGGQGGPGGMGHGGRGQAPTGQAPTGEAPAQQSQGS